MSVSLEPHIQEKDGIATYAFRIPGNEIGSEENAPPSGTLPELKRQRVGLLAPVLLQIQCLQIRGVVTAAIGGMHFRMSISIRFETTGHAATTANRLNNYD